MTNCENTTLCELALTRFEELDKRWEVKISAIQSSINKAEIILSARLETMNEFRRQIDEERKAYITRRETVLINFVMSLIIASMAAFIAHLLSK